MLDLKFKKIAFCGAVSMICMLPSFSNAQVAAGSGGPYAGAGVASADAASDQLETITVTAQRRKENLQDTPVTVVAVSGEDLIQRGVSDALSLPSVVPGLTMSSIGGFSAPFIRGVGTTSIGPGDESSVATYVDGVYIAAQSASLFSFNNIAQIEVDKGPQGTLFGRNATGGVIQVTTKDPSQTPTLDFRVGYGNFDTFEESLYASTGITQNLAADIAVYALNQQDGWGRYFTGQEAFRNSDISARTKWVFTPVEGTKITFSGDFDRSVTGEGVTVYPVPGSIAVNGQTFVGPYTPTGAYSFASNEQEGGSVKVEQDFGWAEFTSISAYRHLFFHAPFDYAGLDNGGFEFTTFNLPDSTASQEFRLSAPESSNVKWVGGLFYIDNTAGFDPIIVQVPDTDINSFTHTDTRSLAGFGQATFEVASATNLTLGARYTWDRLSITGHNIINGSPPIGPAIQNSQTEKPTWRVSLDHKFTSDVLGFVSYNRGLKSGVYNAQVYTAPAVLPETLDAYEIGTKTEWLDHRLKANASVYLYNYKDIQVVEFFDGVQEDTNAAKARIYGLDLDLAASPFSGFLIQGSFSYIHGRYTSFGSTLGYLPTGVGGNTTTTVDATGNDTVHTPTLSGSVSANYVYRTPVGEFDFSVNDAYIGSFAWEPDNRLQNPAVSLLGATITWSPNARWDVRLWGKNLQNRLYFVEELSEPLTDSASPAPPRTYGVSFGVHY
jgi:iron complex outermembrane recepter protein